MRRGLAVNLVARWFSETKMARNTRKPPEEPTNCCGNGCQNCVWIDFWKEMDDFRRETLAADPALVRPETSANRLVEDEDPSMKAFLELEKKISKRS